jgi:hypothetical protein
MDFFYALTDYLHSIFGGALWVIVPFALFIGMVAQMRLYAKAEQPALAAVVPGWNFIVFMKVIGRPLIHSLFIMVPIVGMLLALMMDYADIFAFAQGNAAFSAVAFSLPLFLLSFAIFAIFMIKAHIELCNSFGRRTVFDYVLVVVLNVLYVLNLGLSYEIEYEGPAYGKTSLSGSEAFA